MYRLNIIKVFLMSSILVKVNLRIICSVVGKQQWVTCLG